ncbi:MAG TPA: hypothetical protein VFB40_14680, partial [Actinocrinis sp.]|nr:hypothetical protein [Actinocrinis sp.]
MTDTEAAIAGRSTSANAKGTGAFLGMPSFPEAARVSTKDARLRANLTRATHTIRARREQAVAELADWAELRAAGAAIKERTLRHLDTYLLQLEEK